MIDVISAIDARRSNRGYSDEKLIESEIAALVKAGTDSPTAVNRQPWHFTVVTDTDFLDKFNSDLAAALSREADKFNVFYHAPCCIFISGPSLEENSWTHVDCGIAVENIALAAVGLGLGSVILGMPKHLFESEKGDEYRKLMKMPEGHDFVIGIAVGRPTMTKDAHPVAPGKVDYIV